MSENTIDNIIESLQNLELNSQYNFEEDDIIYIINTAEKIIKLDNVCLELEAPINIIGDIHGQFYDLLEIFNDIGSPDNHKYLFLGDYVDRGKFNLETIILLLCYKIKFNDTFYLLRGNHECVTINKLYGFYDECKRRYNTRIWKLFCNLFCYFPITAVINEKILSMHGGLSPVLKNIENLKKINLPTEVPDKGLICDLLWSDPTQEVNGWAENERGVSFNFGSDVTKYFLKKNNLELILRAHQVVEDGYEFCHDKLCLTIFSAKNYCNEFDNNAGILQINEDLVCKIKIIKCNTSN